MSKCNPNLTLTLTLILTLILTEAVTISTLYNLNRILATWIFRFPDLGFPDLGNWVLKFSDDTYTPLYKLNKYCSLIGYATRYLMVDIYYRE